MTRTIVVEDNLLISVIYRHYLRKLNIELVAEVTTGERAIEVVRENEIDFIVMDIMLEGEIDGIEAMRQIREFTSIPVIFATGNSDDFHVKKATAIPNSLFLVKPVTEENFSEAIEKLKEF